MSEDEVLDIVEQVLQSPQSSQSTREYAINAVMKLSTRFSVSLPRIKSIVSRYTDHLDMELQQRAVEYSAIFVKHDQMRCVDSCQCSPVSCVVLRVLYCVCVCVSHVIWYPLMYIAGIGS